MTFMIWVFFWFLSGLVIMIGLCYNDYRKGINIDLDTLWKGFWLMIILGPVSIIFAAYVLIEDHKHKVVIKGKKK